MLPSTLSTESEFKPVVYNLTNVYWFGIESKHSEMGIYIPKEQFESFISEVKKALANPE